MPKIARRFTIITLTMALFALSFSAFVETQRRTPELQAGRASVCQPFTGNGCDGTL